MSAARAAYQQNRIESASPAELVLMLYDGLGAALERSLQSLEAHKMAATHDHLVKAQAILQELMRALNMEAGEVSHNLFNLYDFMSLQLAEANLQKNPAGVKRVLLMIEPIREAWQQAVIPLSRAA